MTCHQSVCVSVDKVSRSVPIHLHVIDIKRGGDEVCTYRFLYPEISECVDFFCYYNDFPS